MEWSSLDPTALLSVWHGRTAWLHMPTYQELCYREVSRNNSCSSSDAIGQASRSPRPRTSAHQWSTLYSPREQWQIRIIHILSQLGLEMESLRVVASRNAYTFRGNSITVRPAASRTIATTQQDSEILATVSKDQSLQARGKQGGAGC